MADKLALNRRRVKYGDLQNILRVLELEAAGMRGELQAYQRLNTQRYEKIKFAYDEIVKIMLELV